MKTMWKTVRRIGGGVAVLLLAVLALLQVVGPRVAKKLAMSSLERAGIPVERIEVRALSLTHIDLSDVAVNIGARLRLDSVRVDFSPRSLRARSLRRVTVSGAEVQLDLADPKTGSLSDLLKGPGSISVPEIVVRSSTLQIAKKGRVWRVPVEASWHTGPGEDYRLSLRSEGGDGSLRIDGSLDARGQTAEIAVAASDLSLSALTGQGAAAGGVRLSGRANAALRLSDVPGAKDTELDVRFEGGGIGEAGRSSFQIEGARLTASCRVDPVGRIATLSGNLLADRLDAAAASVSGIDLKFHKKDDNLVFRFMATNEQCRFESAWGEVPGLFTMLPHIGETSAASERWCLGGGVVVSNIAIVAGSSSCNVGTAKVTLRSDAAATLARCVRVDASFERVDLGREPIRLDVPVLDGTAVLPLGGVFAVQAHGHIPSIVMGGQDLGGLSGSMTASGGIVRAQAVWPLGESENLTVTGLVQRADGGDEWSGEARVPPFRLSGNAALAALVRERCGWDMSGVFSGSSRFRLSENNTDVRLTLSATNVAISKAETAAEGICGSVTFESLDPLRTPGNQRFGVKQVRIGDTQLEDGLVVFRVESSDTVFLEQTRWKWCGGVLSSLGCRYSLSEPTMDVSVFAEDLDVKEILALLLKERAAGTGRVYGRLPLRIRWRPSPGLSLGQGYLLAGPEGGTFVLRDPKLLDTAFGDGLAGAGKDKTLRGVKDGIARSLEDFQYSSLGVNFVGGRGGRPAGTIHLEGRGRKPDAVPLSLTINFSEDSL